MNARAVILAVILTGALGLVAPAEAGDRELYVIFVNMTPDAESSDVSKACVKQIESKIKKDYAQVTRIGETKMRKRVGKSKGEAMMSWPVDVFDGAKKIKDDRADAIVLVDCRPEKKILEVVVAPNATGVARFRLRGVELDKTATALISTAILRRAWIGFSP